MSQSNHSSLTSFGLHTACLDPIFHLTKFSRNLAILLVTSLFFFREICIFVTTFFLAFTFLTENTVKLFRRLAAWPWGAVGVGDLPWVSWILAWVPARLYGCFDTHS